MLLQLIKHRRYFSLNYSHSPFASSAVAAGAAVAGVAAIITLAETADWKSVSGFLGDAVAFKICSGLVDHLPIKVKIFKVSNSLPIAQWTYRKPRSANVQVPYRNAFEFNTPLFLRFLNHTLWLSPSSLYTSTWNASERITSLVHS